MAIRDARDRSNHPDRYVSFHGIDCDGAAALVAERVRALIDDPARNNPLWERFKQKMDDPDAGQSGRPDLLYLVCSHVYYIAELFEVAGDAEGMELVEKLECDCC